MNEIEGVWKEGISEEKDNERKVIHYFLHCKTDRQDQYFKCFYSFWLNYIQTQLLIGFN